MLGTSKKAKATNCDFGLVGQPVTLDRQSSEFFSISFLYFVEQQ